MENLKEKIEQNIEDMKDALRWNLDKEVHNKETITIIRERLRTLKMVLEWMGE